MPASNRYSLLVTFLLLVLFPLVFLNIGLASLAKLHIDPQTALTLVLAIVVGGLINIPVKRIARESVVWSHPLAVYGLADAMPYWRINRHETIIAVNVGGCLIPVGIAAYQFPFLAAAGADAIWAVTVATTLSSVVCFFFARPIPNVGIVMPGFVAPLTALLLAVTLAPDHAPPVAFVAGVLGPLIGADFLHLDAFTKTPVGVASIGGAGTFDGIVLSGLLAAFLA